jgi:hypothetical protein
MDKFKKSTCHTNTIITMIYEYIKTIYFGYQAVEQDSMLNAEFIV